MNEKLTASNIKYLLTLGDLSYDNPGVRVTDIAKALNVSKPSVHAMISTLQDMGIAEKDRYGTIYLTTCGKGLAKRYKSYFTEISIFMNNQDVKNSDSRTAICAMLAELTESDIKAICKNIREQTATIVDDCG